MTSEATARGRTFVAAHQLQAIALGDALAELTEEPEVFVAALTTGLRQLADPVYAAEQGRVAPGSRTVIGVRWPLVHAVERPVRAALREGSGASALWLAQRLAQVEPREVRLFSLVALSCSLPDDPERSWQLMRRLAGGATDWIEVDSLAETWAAGVLAEPYRWAELEQLVYSSRRMERRLVGSTVARLAHALPVRRRAAILRPLSVRALGVVEALIGDPEPDVQKALSWALREWARVDPEAVEELLRREARVALQTGDGQRAWVVRDALAALPAPLGAELRQMVKGIRRRAGQPSTSEASRQAAAYGSLVATAGTIVAGQGDRFGGRRA